MRRQLITRLGAGALLLAGLSAGSVPAQAGAPAKQPTFQVGWTPCPDAPTVQCGTLQVPLDWSKPNGQRVPVAVARRPADNPGARIGTLFYNPGGPGDPSTRYVLNARRFFSETVLTRFDLVAIDPRGTGGSVQVRCGANPYTPQTTYFPRTEEQFEQMRRQNREFGQSCLQLSGAALLRNVDTATVARDHEALRQALRVDRVSWLGISYGAQLAANYAHLYPRHTRAMVIDAALDHSLPEVVQATDEIMSVENAFNRFARWCDTAPTCALRGQDVAAVFDQLVARADANPIPVEGALRPVTGEDIRMGAKTMLSLKEPTIIDGPSWPDLSQALAAALAGNASAFMLYPAGVPQDWLFGISANACSDYVPQVDSWAEMQQRIQLGRQLAPHMQGASDTWRVNGCIGWPVKASNPPKALDVRGVPTLLVHAVHDSMDPYRWSHALATQIQDSDMLTRTGDGHTSYYTSPCARTAIDAYLVRPQAPADSVCDE